MWNRAKTRRRRQPTWWWAAGIGAFLVVSWFGWTALRSESAPVDPAGLVTTLVGNPAPVLRFPDAEGKVYNVPERGRPTVLIFHMGLF